MNNDPLTERLAIAWAEQTSDETRRKEMTDECKGGATVAVDWIAGEVLHENDEEFHGWDPSIYGEAGR